MLALRTEEGEPLPRHSLASARINDPGCCSPSTAATLGLPLARDCPCVWLTTSRQSSQKYPALGHRLLLRLGDIPSAWTQGS